MVNLPTEIVFGVVGFVLGVIFSFVVLPGWLAGFVVSVIKDLGKNQNAVNEEKREPWEEDPDGWKNR